MKIKKNFDNSRFSDEFYYDLFVGGYFAPEDFLEDKKDIKAVNEAIKLIKQYELLLIENGLCEEK